MGNADEPDAVKDVRAAYRAAEPEAGVQTMNEAERLWLDAEIDKGLASPRIADRTARQVMAEIRTKNRALHG